jgi:hypothetical protein
VSPDEAVVRVLNALEHLGVPYMLVGSFSSNTYGVPRSTNDVDFVVQVESGGVRRIMDQLGPQFRLQPQITFEAITATTRYIVELTDSPFRIEFFLLSDDPHDQQRFARRQPVRLPGHDVTAVMPSPEDVIITKVRWSKSGGRMKDLDDARGVIAVQGDRLDWDYIHHWCDVHGTRDLLDQVRRSIPPL